ncbi:MAG: DUF167 domain-containing protein [Candidatus Yanofskybacteria bacterium]|nr:DUF167 domain-containing protein [Candidatus Yanofskybacteria bacterium]
MKISVKIKTGSKKEEIKKVGNDSFEIKTKALPIEGKANSAVTKILADYFDIPKSRVKILKGQKSKLKILEIS